MTPYLWLCATAPGVLMIAMTARFGLAGYAVFVIAFTIWILVVA